MKKKFVLCSLVLSLLFAAPCTAETVFDDPKFLSDGYVSIEGKSDVKNGQITFKAAREGETLDYVAIKETTSDDEGKFSFMFRIPELINGSSSNGTYKAYITAENETVKELTFEYISFEYMLKKIKAAKSGEELYTIINGCTEDDKAALVVMGMAMTELDNISSKLSSITETWYKVCDLENAESAEVASSFNKAMGLEYAKSGDTETALKLINPSYNDVAFKTADNQTALVEVMDNNMDDDSLEEFNEAYVLANKIIEFRELRAAELVEAINDYDEYFGFSDSSKYSSYSGMTLTKQGKVADNMSKYISSSTVKASEILSAFESAVKSVEGSSTSTSGSGSGGGGGRSTGSYSSGATASQYQVEVKETQTNEFADLDDVEWAVEAITALAEKGIVSGGGDGRFNPNNSVTREEFTKMTVLACGMYNSGAECDFSDVGKDDWYYSYVASAVDRGIIKGIGDGAFGAGSRITREDMAVIVKRTADAAGISFAQTKPVSEFADSYMISDYAKESINELYCAGIINGVGGNAFAPTENCTRAQAAKIIYEAFVKQ